jgi:hypothetical protein
VTSEPANRGKRPRPAMVAALLVWLVWLTSCAVLWWQWRARVMPPHFVPVVPLMAIQLLAAAAAVLMGLWRTVRGPRRLAALSWALAAVIPVLLSAAHASYTLACLQDNRMPVNLATRTALVAGAGLMDAEARLRYPRRLSGERVVMIYDTLADPQRDVAAMDRHVAKLERILGRCMPGKVHWLRGPALGLGGGRAFQGVAMGGLGDPGPDGLTEVDRHEAAHVVLSHHLPADAEPPTVLNEGWAESQQGSPPESLSRRLWDFQVRGQLPTLRELVGPDWYCRMEPPVYVYGGPLVDYLLRRYGAEKFFQLCATCRQETFEADCRRVLGVGLDELHRQFWADASRQIGPRDQCVSALLGLPAPGPTDEAARDEFLARYPQEVKKLQSAYQNARIAALRRVESKGKADGEDEPPWTEELEVARRGDRARLVRRENGFVSVWVAAPSGSFHLKKNRGSKEFTLKSFSSGSELGSRAVLEEIRIYEGCLRTPYRLADDMAEPGFTIINVVKSTRNGKSLLSVHFESRSLFADKPVLTAGWLSLSPDDCWAMHESEVHWRLGDEAPAMSKTRVQYGPKQAGIPALQEVQVRMPKDDGRDMQTTCEVESLDFGPVPDAEFQLAAFGLEPPREQVDIFTRIFRFSIGAAALVTMTLVVAVALQVVRRRASCSP